MSDYTDAPTTPCSAPGCTRPADPVLCRVDTGKLGDMLAELGAMFDRLDAAPSMQGKDPDSVGSSGGLKSHRNVGDLDVMGMRDRQSREREPEDPDGTNTFPVAATIHDWAATIRDERGLELPTVVFDWLPGLVFTARPSFADDRRLLADRHTFRWILEQEWAGEFYDAIRGAWRALDNATKGRRPRRSAVCACGGRITVTAMVAECGGCGARWEGLELARLGAVA